MTQRHGFDPEVWERAREEARQILIQCAREGRKIAYSDLAAELDTVSIEPNSSAFHAMLDEISLCENKAGRGMLSVLVIRKDIRTSGPGFFRLARKLGRKFKDDREFWKSESKRVIGSWRRVLQ